MTAHPVGALHPAPAAASDFVAGARFTLSHRDETVSFVFGDDAWWLIDRMRPNDLVGQRKIDFSPLPLWIRGYAKQFVAHHWLDRRASQKDCARSCVALRFLCGILGPDFPGPVAALGRSHAARVAAECERQARISGPLIRGLAGKGLAAKNRAMRDADVISPDTLQRYAGRINSFASWLRESPRDLEIDFRVKLSREVDWQNSGSEGADQSVVISDDLLADLLAATDADLAAYRTAAVEYAERTAAGRWRRRVRGGPGGDEQGTAKRWLNNILRPRAIKAQALRLQLLAARRGGAVTLLRVDARTTEDVIEPNPGERMRVLSVEFRSFKGDGEEGAPELIPFPGYFGEIAEAAIQTAIELTAPERARARPEDAPYLFLKRSGRPLAGSDLQRYLTEDCVEAHGRRRQGLIQRYGIRGAECLAVHKARHTMAHEIANRGGSVFDIGRYLGHEVDGNGLWAARFYLTGGSPERRHRAAVAMQTGQATGLVFDAAARLATRAMGPMAEVLNVPPNQLTYAEAVARFRREGIEVREDDWTPEAVEGLLRQGMVVSMTGYGGCVLPAKTGPCPTAEKCPIGVAPEAPETAEGRGCPYQVLMPHARELLEEEIAMMELKIAFYETRPRYSFWLSRERRQLGIWRKQVAHLDAMALAAGAREAAREAARASGVAARRAPAADAWAVPS